MPLIRISDILDADGATRGSEDALCISADGRYAAFLGTRPPRRHAKRPLFVYDVVEQRASQVTPTIEGVWLAPDTLSLQMSHDGRLIAFLVDARESALAPPLGGDVFIYDWQADVVTPLGLHQRGLPAEAEAITAEFSDDMNLAVVQIAHPLQDAGPLLIDRERGLARKLDCRAPCRAFQPAISGDGRVVAFLDETDCDDVGAGSGMLNLWLVEGPGRRCEVARLGRLADDTVAGQLMCFEDPRLSKSGRILTVLGAATIGLSPPTSLLIWDRPREALVLVPRGPDGQLVSGGARSAVVSEEAGCVVFASGASGLVPGDSNEATDVFLYDWVADRFQCLSAFDARTAANGPSRACDMSNDGRVVVFWSAASNLVPGDRNEAPDIFLWQR
ncbi:MAG TPA: hypothetical protein VFD43_12530 [Planctomycetota bacterium]|nr:hypothetical protein [Planctomycetota bacterium]